MVWGMSLPSSGGKFGPYGEHEGKVDNYGDGWRHRLKTHLSSQTPDIQRQLFPYDGDEPGFARHHYPGYVSRKFHSEVGSRNTPQPSDPPITPIHDHEPPRFYATEKNFDILSSVISLPGMNWAVDEGFKNIVDRLEPNFHQFFPLEIVMPRGKIYPTTYFTLAVGKFFDALRPDMCKRTLRPYGSNRYHVGETKDAITGLAFCAAEFGQSHLWRERSLGAWLLCLSDEFREETRKANLLMPKHYRMIEV